MKNKDVQESLSLTPNQRRDFGRWKQATINKGKLNIFDALLANNQFTVDELAKTIGINISPLRTTYLIRLVCNKILDETKKSRNKTITYVVNKDRLNELIKILGDIPE